MGSSLRSNLRAPLYREVLFQDENHVLKCLGVNISLGGVLLGLLPHVPQINLIPLILEIPKYPLFSQMDKDKIKYFIPSSVTSTIVRVRAKMVRSFEGKSDVDKIFIQNIGCQFIDKEITQELIPTYVETVSSNIIFLLSLFESSHAHAEQIVIIRKISEVLGYPKDESLSLLRQKILHDYQSLESS